LIIWKEEIYAITSLNIKHSTRSRQVSKIIEFFISCCIVALQYLHSMGIIHRDIKPENLVMDGKGYIRLTDMGIARFW